MDVKSVSVKQWLLSKPLIPSVQEVVEAKQIIDVSKISLESLITGLEQTKILATPTVVMPAPSIQQDSKAPLPTKVPFLNDVKTPPPLGTMNQNQVDSLLKVLVIQPQQTIYQLSQTNPESMRMLYEAIGLIVRDGFDKTIKFLTSTKPNEVLSNLPTMQKSKERVKMDLALSEDEQVAVEGAGSCPRCQGTRLAFSQYTTRSGDEAATVSIFCLSCELSWRG